jgi:hypothetical protein
MWIASSWRRFRATKIQTPNEVSHFPQEEKRDASSHHSQLRYSKTWSSSAGIVRRRELVAQWILLTRDHLRASTRKAKPGTKKPGENQARKGTNNQKKMMKLVTSCALHHFLLKKLRIHKDLDTSGNPRRKEGGVLVQRIIKHGCTS